MVKVFLETRNKGSYCIGCCADKLGPRLPVSNQAVIKKYTDKTNSSPEHPSGSQNWEKPNFGRLDSPSPKKNQKLKRIKLDT